MHIAITDLVATILHGVAAQCNHHIGAVLAAAIG